MLHENEQYDRDMNALKHSYRSLLRSLLLGNESLTKEIKAAGNIGDRDDTDEHRSGAGDGRSHLPGGSRSTTLDAFLPMAADVGLEGKY